jgi:integrase
VAPSLRILTASDSLLRIGNCARLLALGQIGEARYAHVFPGQRKAQPLSNMAFLTLLKRMNATPKGEQSDPDAKAKWHDPASGRAITAHGFRATFKTWAEEVATFPHAVIEHAMGHKVGGKVERAYTRTTLLYLRRKLMDAWAAYCEPKATDEKVTPLRRKA